MRLLLFVVLPFLLLLGPALWVQWVLRRHARDNPALPGTGGDLARHLIARFGLTDVKLESTPLGDHYDPQTRTVRLTPANMDGRSLTAAATAAHEVGHALQHACGYAPLLHRTQLARFALQVQRVAGGVFIVAPVVLVLTRSPGAAMLLAALAFLLVLVTTAVHLVTLPVEFDASFGRALPVLQDLGLMNGEELAVTRRILLACALTYVSQSLLAVLTLRFWLLMLTRA